MVSLDFIEISRLAQEERKRGLHCLSVREQEKGRGSGVQLTERGRG
jgi:hypothetical protein